MWAVGEGISEHSTAPYEKGEEMRVGVIDVDGHNYPNLPLMKLSAWHKSVGDTVEWYEPIMGHFDRVYMSKVFSFTPDYEWCIDADEIIKGGSGYCIVTENGKEKYLQENDKPLPPEIEHIYPDYGLYGITDTAYGYLSRGCPRGCDFCHVAAKEGRRAYKVADLAEWWHGQKNIVLMDPNILACPQWEDLLGQLADSKAWVDVNQGMDIRLMDDARISAITKLKTKVIHFAWDRYEDGDIIKPRFKAFKEASGIDYRKLIVYVLCAFNTTIEQDLERLYWLRDAGYTPFVMLYDKQHLPKTDPRRRMANWCNKHQAFRACARFEEFAG